MRIIKIRIENHLASDRGFSLVEIIASITVFGFFTVLFSQFFRQSIRAFQTLNASQELVDWSRTVSLSLGDSEFCSKSLFNSLGTIPRWAPDPIAAGIAQNQQLAEIRIHSAGEILASLIPVAGAPRIIRGLFTTSALTLTESDSSRRTLSSGSTRYFAQLSISGMKTSGGYSSKGIDKKYYLWVTTDSTHTITSCSLDTGGSSGTTDGSVLPGAPPDTGGMARISGNCEAPDSESDAYIYAGYVECPSGKTIRAAGVDCGNPRTGSLLSSYPVTTSKWYASCCVDGTPTNLTTMIKLICA